MPNTAALRRLASTPVLVASSGTGRWRRKPEESIERGAVSADRQRPEVRDFCEAGRGLVCLAGARALGQDREALTDLDRVADQLVALANRRDRGVVPLGDGEQRLAALYPMHDARGLGDRRAGHGGS